MEENYFNMILVHPCTIFAEAKKFLSNREQLLHNITNNLDNYSYSIFFIITSLLNSS